MAVLGPASLDTIGTGVYALHGALCNSELEPNCWCCFELVAAAGDEPASVAENTRDDSDAYAGAEEEAAQKAEARDGRPAQAWA